MTVVKMQRAGAPACSTTTATAAAQRDNDVNFVRLTRCRMHTLFLGSLESLNPAVAFAPIYKRRASYAARLLSSPPSAYYYFN